MNKNSKHEGRPSKNNQRQLLSFMDAEIERLTAQNRLSTAYNYLSSRRSFARFLHSRNLHDIAFRQLDAQLMSDYQQWVLFDGMERKKNTSSFYLRNLKAVYNKALSYGILTRSSTVLNPFEAVYTGVAETRKRAVPPELLYTLSRLDVERGLQTLVEAPSRKSFQRILREVSFARDIFIFCFCAQGLPFIDFAHLRRENIAGGYITYERHKTGRHVQMAIYPMMQTIIDRYATSDSPYVFPILTAIGAKESYRQYHSALRRYNRRLKLLSQLLGDGVNLTTYVARHSWATAAYRGNIPIAYISEAMGHANEHTTRKYLKSLERSKIDQANKQLMDAIFETD